MSTKALFHLNGNLNDSSGNSETLTSSNTSFTSAKFGQGIHFTGASDSYLEYNGSNSFDTGSFTIEFFCQLVGSYGVQYDYMERNNHISGGDDQQFKLYSQTGGSSYLSLTGKNGIYLNIDITSKVGNGQYYHVAFSYDASAHMAYLAVDGVVQSQPITITAATGTSLSFGNQTRLRGMYSHAYEGNFDEIRISDTALYTANFTPPSAEFIVGAPYHAYKREIPTQFFTLESGNIKIKDMFTTLPLFVLDSSKHNPNTVMTGENYALTTMTTDFSFAANKLELNSFAANGWFSDIEANLKAFSVANKDILFGGHQEHMMCFYGTPTINGTQYFVAFFHVANMDGTEI